MNKPNQKKFASFLEKGVIDVINSNKLSVCESCGQMCRESEMESVLIDDERTPALVCPKCYFGLEERADEVDEGMAYDEWYDREVLNK